MKGMSAHCDAFGPLRLPRHRVLCQPAVDQSIVLDAEILERGIAEYAQAFCGVEHAIPPPLAHPFPVTAPRPSCRMRHHSSSDHVQFGMTGREEIGQHKDGIGAHGDSLQRQNGNLTPEPRCGTRPMLGPARKPSLLYPVQIKKWAGHENQLPNKSIYGRDDGKDD